MFACRLFVFLLVMVSPVCLAAKHNAQAQFAVTVRVLPPQPDPAKLTVRCSGSACQVTDANPVAQPSYTLDSYQTCTAAHECTTHVTIAY